VLGNPSKVQGIAERCNRRKQLDHLCPGLCDFENILITSSDLPHPAVKLMRNTDVVRSVSVARVTRDLLDRCVIPPILKSLKNVQGLEGVRSDVKIIRLSRGDRARMVSLHDSSAKSEGVSVLSLEGRRLLDSPIDCPEYVCFFVKAGSKAGEAQLYSEITVHDGISESSLSIELLENIKKQNASAFSRSLAFILVVKRNIQTLLLYNTKPELAEVIKKTFAETGATNRTQVSKAKNHLEVRALKQLLSPTCEEEGQNEKLVPLKPAAASNSSAKSTVETPANSSNAEPSAPTRRIRRPTAIRRPKLIGKSVEGSAIQAVAASRNRARTNQFKNLATVSSPARKAPQQGPQGTKPIASASTSNTQHVAKPPSLSTSNTVSNDDRLSGGMKVDPSKLLSGDFLLRLGSLFSQARLQIANTALPTNPAHRIPLSIANSLTCIAPVAWCDICRPPPLPPNTLNSFMILLGRWVTSVNKEVDILSASGDSIVFRSEVRNVNGVRCFALVRFSASDTFSKTKIVRSKGWILNLPRRSWMRQNQKQLANDHSSLVVDRDGVGLDTVLSAAYSSLRLSSVMFDFCSSIIERTARMLDDRLPLNELSSSLRGLIQQYPYERQEEMAILNYRAFTGMVILKSYRDELIDMFDAPRLFQRLSSESNFHDMICCGDLLCFKRNINIKGTRSE
jgi:hypothetical protein